MPLHFYAAISSLHLLERSAALAWREVPRDMTEEDFIGDFIAMAVFLAASLEIAVALYLVKRIGGAPEPQPSFGADASQVFGIE